jgi:ribosomal protein S18 acetylase RimI-like enzyme
VTAQRAVPRVRLVPLDPATAVVRLAATVSEYGRVGVEAGWWSGDAADERARAATDAILPGGVATPGHWFWALTLDDGARAGWLWVGPSRDGSRWWVWDLRVDLAFRGRGVGAGALRALDERARAAGQAVIGLHVMADNDTAHALYLREGFLDAGSAADGTGVVMEKRLDG